MALDLAPQNFVNCTFFPSTFKFQDVWGVALRVLLKTSNPAGDEPVYFLSFPGALGLCKLSVRRLAGDDTDIYVEIDGPGFNYGGSFAHAGLNTWFSLVMRHSLVAPGPTMEFDVHLDGINVYSSGNTVSTQFPYDLAEIRFGDPMLDTNSEVEGHEIRRSGSGGNPMEFYAGEIADIQSERRHSMSADRFTWHPFHQNSPNENASAVYADWAGKFGLNLGLVAGSSGVTVINAPSPAYDL